LQHGGVAQLAEAASKPTQIEIIVPVSVFTAERQIKCLRPKLLDAGANPAWLAISWAGSLAEKHNDIRLSLSLKRAGVRK
jgi:hypothetical protein